MKNLTTSSSNLRGIVGRDLTPAVVTEYASAFGAYLKRTCRLRGRQRLKICIGRDSRLSGNFFESAIVAGLCASGIDVVQLGIVTTPCVGIMLAHLGCAGGMVVTASDEPAEYNGIKLLLGSGSVLSKEILSQLQQIYRDKDFDYVCSAESGQGYYSNMVDEVHIDKIRVICQSARIAKNKFKVVLDSVNGAGGRVTMKLLEALGCDVVGINLEPTGKFAHNPKLLKENLAELCRTVKKHRADIGFAQDPGADKLAIVDNNGRCIGSEYVLALAAESVLAKNSSGIVTDDSVSKMIDLVAGKFGCSLFRISGGEAGVVEAMLKNNCCIGGDGNGGVIDVRISPARDSLAAIALVLQLMADKSKSISDIVDSLSSFAASENETRSAVSN